MDSKGGLIAGVGATVLGAVAIGAYLLKGGDKPAEEVKVDKTKPSIILLGDVGGTNVRLVLKKVYLHDPSRPSEVLKDSSVHSQRVKSFEEAVRIFLQVSWLPYNL